MKDCGRGVHQPRRHPYSGLVAGAGRGDPRGTARDCAGHHRPRRRVGVAVLRAVPRRHAGIGGGGPVGPRRVPGTGSGVRTARPGSRSGGRQGARRLLSAGSARGAHRTQCRCSPGGVSHRCPPRLAGRGRNRYRPRGRSDHDRGYGGVALRLHRSVVRCQRRRVHRGVGHYRPRAGTTSATTRTGAACVASRRPR